MNQTLPLIPNVEERRHGARREREHYRIGAGKQICAARRDKDMTQVALAQHLGVSPKVIGYMEAGSRKIEIGDVLMIARALGMSAEVLIRRILSW